ncbi:hypothetical protein HUJ05_004477 [Dendroctonus ponderosae]|nr:hypothetical protein HUJ05_004477 [Dendroctonus ponderosae]
MNSGVCCVLLSNSETDQLVPSAGDLWNLQPESWNVQPENRAQNSLETFQLLMQNNFEWIICEDVSQDFFNLGETLQTPISSRKIINSNSKIRLVQGLLLDTVTTEPFQITQSSMRVVNSPRE